MATIDTQTVDGTSYLPDRTLSPSTSTSVPSTMPHPPLAFPGVFPPPTTAPPQPIIAIDPVALITTECITITSAMRKHARWSQSSVSAILGGGASRVHEQQMGRSASQRRSALANAQGNANARDRVRQVSIPDPTSRTASPGIGRGVNTQANADEEDGGVSLASRWGLRGQERPESSRQPSPQRLRTVEEGSRQARKISGV